MKQIFKLFFLILIMMMITIEATAGSLNPQQIKLRSDIVDFLREEGFMPEIDSDGDIFFKREGKKWYVCISTVDVSPMFIHLSRMFAYDETYTKEALERVDSEVNAYKGIKLRINNNGFTCAAEMYVVNADPLKFAFYKLVRQIDSMVSNLQELVENGTPLTVESVDVANVDGNGDIIVNYGKTIYHNQTKYIKFKLHTIVKTAGTYIFNVKFYGSNGQLTTAGDASSVYSYNTTVTLGVGRTEVFLPGWGSNTSGHWKAGHYRAEFYLNEQFIGEKEYDIY